MKAKELSSFSKDELLTKEKDLRQELFNLRLRQQTGSVEKPSRITEVRKDIARIETILNQQKKGVQKTR